MHNCKARNINAEPLEELLLSLLRNNILNPDTLDEVADQFLSSSTADSSQTVEEMRRELAGVEESSRNLWLAVERGLSNPAVFARIDDHESRAKSLQLKIQELVERPQIEKNFIVNCLMKDAQLLFNDEIFQKEIIKRYIERVEIGDELITVQVGFAPFGGHSGNSPQKNGDIPFQEYVTWTGSPGADLIVFTHRVQRSVMAAQLH